MKQIRLTYLMK